ncbi:hypothetical protein C0Q70_13189 [Pomacea canaliculata]|uniref:EGF-like domain-containing protein n=1 Tax=Pomacea canaliculata TaxID=400727 RepID=A0A2T7NWI4_POMCA|nr:hypothetical protein C0Q70_13189 [Pomacea canaliculata]
MSSFNISADPCHSSPCLNDGRCQSFKSVYICDCYNNFAGLRAEHSVAAANLAGLQANTSCAAFLCPLFGANAFGLIIIIALCVMIAKKRKRRQRELQLRSAALDVSANFQSDTRVSTLTSVSDHPTAEHPYSVRYTRTDSQTSTCVIEHISLSEYESSHLSPQQPHLHDNYESRLDGGSVNDGYDHVRDLPPSYLSVVTDPRYIRDEGDSVQQLPSYDDVVAAVRSSPAPRDRKETLRRNQTPGHPDVATSSSVLCKVRSVLKGFVFCAPSPPADPCLSSPCQNGGQCAGYGSGYFCFCVNGFWGWNCEVGDHCASSSCRNGGTCQSLYSGYSCSCATGYAGFNCDFPDPCLSSPCQNGGRCVSYGGVYLCHCSSTYTGLRCERRAEHSVADASSQDLNQDLNQDFKPNTSKKSCAELICPLFGVIGFGLIVIIAVCFVITKKRKRRQRDLQLRSGAHDVSAYFQSDTRVSTLTSVSDHPTAEHPYSVHDTSTDSQTSTCVIEHFSLSELESSHLSPEQHISMTTRRAD